MKKFIKICAVILLTSFAYRTSAQTVTPPEFPGGEKGFDNFVDKNLKWPITDKTIQGDVIISFFVEKDGRLSDIRVTKGLNPALDKEALRVISLSPKWTPAMKNDKPVKSKYSETISFTLQTIKD